MPGFLVVLGIIAAIPLVSAAVGQLGFTAAGVAAGSIAAGIQSIVYGAFTCGLFSILQSFGATLAPVIGSPYILGGLTLLGILAAVVF